MNIQSLIKQFPSPLKQGLKYIYRTIPLRLRKSKTFWETYKLLQESQWWDKERLEDYQMQQLEKLLIHAYENVPYYRRVFDERGLKPIDIKSKEDLIKLPILTKDIVRNNINDLLAKNIDRKKLHPIKTSGTTVSPLSFFWHKNITIPKEDSFTWTIYNIAGYKFSEKLIYLSFELPPDTKGKLRQYNPLERTMLLYASGLNEDTLHSYVDLIRKFQPKVLKGIPSNLVVLANFIVENKIPIFPQLKIILCSSEMLYPWQKDLVEKAFKCRLFSLYGQNEAVVLATECEVSHKYHVFPEYGVTEIIDANGLPIQKERCMGSIIGTGFNNYALPFIRYEIGDVAAWSYEKCRCGRHYPLFHSIEGRENEYLVSSNGELIPMIIIPYSLIMKNVKQFQFYQEIKGKVKLKLVPLPAFTQDDAESIVASLKQNLKDMEVRIEYADVIPRNKRGKFKYIIQKLPVKFGHVSP